MKLFDLEAAKRGEPIVTRDGRKATYVGHAPDASKPYRLVVLLAGSEYPQTFYEDGAHQCSRVETGDDLFMAPRKRTVYVNLWPTAGCLNAIWYDSVDEARNASNASTGAIATAVPVEIED